MGIAKLTRNFQITLPKDVREIRKLKEGDKVLFTIDGDKINILKLEDDIIEKTAGMWNIKETGIEYKKRLRATWKKRRERLGY